MAKILQFPQKGENDFRVLEDIVIERYEDSPIDAQATFDAWEREERILLSQTFRSEVLADAKPQRLFARTLVFRAIEAQEPSGLTQFRDQMAGQQFADLYGRHLVPLFDYLLGGVGSNQHDAREILIRYTPTSYLHFTREDGPPHLHRVSRHYRKKFPAATQFLFLKSKA